MFSASDTIVAIATPPGRGGIGVIRVSGPDALAIASSLSGVTAFQPRHATLVTLRDPASNSPLDQALLTWFQAPHSYTGDDVVEMAGHGSPAALDGIVRAVSAAGARLAEPGEFTFRAYLNGRIDLVQAEAVADLIEAVTPAQARVAMDQLGGTLTSRIRAIDAQVFDVAAKLEASLDFPDEGFHFIGRSEAQASLEQARDALDALLQDGRRGRVIREGRVVVIAGRPNVGKSSLFNALVGNARAIVTQVPGTTRDLLIETIELDGIPITLVDTAGVRETTDEVEVEGVSRAREAMASAALTVLVLDGSSALTDDDRTLLRDSRGPRVVVVNKADQPGAWHPDALDTVVISTSATTRAGIDRLRSALTSALIEHETLSELPAISNIRHLHCAEVARTSVDRALSGIADGAAEEIVLAELSDARRALEELTGTRTPDDVLAHIFSHFCIGK